MVDATGVIVLAVYRPDPTLLERQLKSIAGQSFGDWSCVVGIDGPDPEAASLVQSLVGADTRFTIVEYPENVGVYRHFERLLTGIRTEIPWIALADQDDYWHPTKVEFLLENLLSRSVSGVGCQASVKTDSGVELGRTHRLSRPLVSSLIVNEVTGCLSIFNSDTLSLALPFPPTSNLARHDHWLGVCAVASRGFWFSDRVLHDYVQHSGNAIGETPIATVHVAVTNILTGRASLTSLTSDPWHWRVDMARALIARTSAQSSQGLATVASGKLSVRLVRLLARQAWSRQIPVRVAIALSVGAARNRHGL